MERWAIIDGNNWVNIDYFGAKKGQFSPATARDNFMARLFDVTAKIRAAKTFICFDSEVSWRKQYIDSISETIDIGYKAGRAEKKDDFWETIGLIWDAVCDSDYAVIRKEGFEADDVIADLTYEATQEGIQSVIYSSDGDLHQCLDTGMVTQCTRVRRVFGGNIEYTYMTSAKLFQEYRAHPWQWVEFRCLAGDTSDKLKAIPGLGPVNAGKVIEFCGSLDGFLANPLAAPINGKWRQKIIDFCKSEKREVFQRLMKLGYQPFIDGILAV